MATLHITVSVNTNLSGHTKWPLKSGDLYHCGFGGFPIESLVTSGGGTAGSFSISGVPDNYDIVTFTGTFDRGTTHTGDGNVAWTGSAIRVADGDDAWASAITTPEPKETEAKAKYQTS